MRSAQSVASRLSPLTAVAVFVAVLYFLYDLARFFSVPLGWDQCWLLYAAERVLSGVELYGPHLIETNPPAIIWFSTIPVLLSHGLHISPALALRLVTLTILVLSTAWSIRVARLDGQTANLNFLCLLACVIFLAGFDLFPDDFGQREQLFVYLTLPYILAAGSDAVRRLSGFERVALGLAAGIGICLKPQQAVVLIALEIFFAFRGRSVRRWLNPEVLAAIAACCLYLLLVLLLTPLYIRNLVPLLVNTYWAFGEGTAMVLAAHSKRYIVEFFFTSLACLLLRRFARPLRVVVPLLVASAAGYFAFLIQHTHWLYHRYPSQAFLEISLPFLLLPLVTALREKTRNPISLEWAFAALALIVLAIFVPRMAHQARASAAETDAAPDELCPFLARESPGTTVSLLSTRLRDFACVFHDNLVWSSRFPHLFIVPAILKNESGPNPPDVPFKHLSPGTVQRLSILQRTDTAEDLNYWQPAVVVIEHCSLTQPCQAIPNRDFDLLPWLLQSPEFRAAWSHYQRQPATLSKYDVYTRVR